MQIRTFMNTIKALEYISFSEKSTTKCEILSLIYLDLINRYLNLVINTVAW